MKKLRRQSAVSSVKALLRAPTRVLGPAVWNGIEVLGRKKDFLEKYTPMLLPEIEHLLLTDISLDNLPSSLHLLSPVGQSQVSRLVFAEVSASGRSP